MYKGADLTYDLESRLQTVEVGSDVQTNAYRADGLRAWKGWNVVAPAQEGDAVAVATYYLYDGGLPVLECNASGTVTAINVFAPDGLVSRKQSGNWRHYQFDPQGSVTHRLTDAEAVTNSSMYDAYGKHVTLMVPVSDAFGYNGRWGYYTDDETGLVLCTYRFYDPGTGRWMTRDPIGYEGGVNLYGYCDSGPIGQIDPYGLTWLYNQATGDLFWMLDGGGGIPFVLPIGNGFSGKRGVSRDNPLFEGVPGWGPIPIGQYTIGDRRSRKSNNRPLDNNQLIPHPLNKMYGRSAFLIHGGQRSADPSEGCIIFDKSVRDFINSTKDRDLIVYRKDRDWLPIL